MAGDVAVLQKIFVLSLRNQPQNLMPTHESISDGKFWILKVDEEIAQNNMEMCLISEDDQAVKKHFTPKLEVTIK